MRAKGFRVSLKMPVEFPRISKEFYNVPLNRQTNIIVKPNMIYPSKDIKDYEPKSRQCFFSHERKLKFFKIYTKANCDIECKSDYINSKCNCVMYSMPHDNTTNVCNSSKLDCIIEAEMNYTTRDLERKLIEKQLKRDIKHKIATKNDERFKLIKKMDLCSCLPSCTSIKYDVEISQTDFDFEDDG